MWPSGAGFASFLAWTAGGRSGEISKKKEDSSFSEEKEAKRLLFLVLLLHGGLAGRGGPEKEMWTGGCIRGAKRTGWLHANIHFLVPFFYRTGPRRAGWPICRGFAECSKSVTNVRVRHTVGGFWKIAKPGLRHRGMDGA
jgi:hypothetical protein